MQTKKMTLFFLPGAAAAAAGAPFLAAAARASETRLILIMPSLSEAPQRETDRDGEARGVVGEPLRRDAGSGRVDLPEGVHDLHRDPETLLELAVEVDDPRRTAGKHDLVDLLGRGRGREKVEGLL